jgi:hypothetical protein
MFKMWWSKDRRGEDTLENWAPDQKYILLLHHSTGLSERVAALSEHRILLVERNRDHPQ